jgi:hypothetical protein
MIFAGESMRNKEFVSERLTRDGQGERDFAKSRISRKESP